MNSNNALQTSFNNVIPTTSTPATTTTNILSVNNNHSNELPTPPSLPLNNSSNNNNINNNRLYQNKSQINNNNNNYSTHPHPHPHPHSYPTHMYYNTNYHRQQAMYHHQNRYNNNNNTHYPPPTPPNTTNNPINPYPIFNGIKSHKPIPQPQPQPQPQQPVAPRQSSVSVHKSLSPSQRTPQPQPKPAVQAQTSTPHPLIIKPRKEAPKSPIKNIHIPPMTRPFMQLKISKSDDEYSSENDSNDSNNDNDNNDNDDDSDYDPQSNSNKSGGKKKSKKSTRIKKKKRKKRKKKRRKRRLSSNSSRSAANNRYIKLGDDKKHQLTYEQASVSIKAMEWKLFRLWLKYNLEPINHHSEASTQLQSAAFQQKMSIFLNFCSLIHVNGVDYYCLWLQIPLKNEWLKLVIHSGEWYTNCTTEKQMMNNKSLKNEKNYWFFRVYEGNNQDEQILLIRCDKNGTCGELVWLQKGQNVSGTDALAIENAISSALDLRWVYLHDDSKIQYGGNSKRSDFRIYLKTIRTIAKGQSWYAQAYYKPFNCKNWPSESSQNKTGVPVGTVFNQNKVKYFNSVKYIRNYSIRQFRINLCKNIDFNHNKKTKTSDKHSQLSKLSNNKRRSNRNKKNNTNIDDNKGPPLDPQELHNFDSILAKINENDPYKQKYGKLPNLDYDPNDNNSYLINPKHYFSFSDDDDNDDITVKEKEEEEEEEEELPKKRKRGRPKKNKDDDEPRKRRKRLLNNLITTTSTRSLRSRAHKSAEEIRREMLQNNNKKCIVSRWYRKRIKIKTNKNSKSEYILNKNQIDDNDNKSGDGDDVDVDTDCEIIENLSNNNKPLWIPHRRRLRTLGDLANICYTEAKPSVWGKCSSNGTKLVREAKENLINFFKTVLTTHDDKEILLLNKEFRDFSNALNTIESTKMFMKISPKFLKSYQQQKHQHKQQQQQQQLYKQQQRQIVQQQQQQYYNHYGNVYSNQYYNNKRNNNGLMRHESEEPLLELGTKKQIEMDYNKNNNNNNTKNNKNKNKHKLLYQQQQHRRMQYQYQQQRNAYYAQQWAYNRSRMNMIHTQHHHQYNTNMYPPPTHYHPHPHPHPHSIPHTQYTTNTHSLRSHRPYNGYGMQLRHEIAGDAEALKRRHLIDKQNLEKHKMSLQNDLNEHLKVDPNNNNNNNKKQNKINNNNNIKHKALFDSLKGPLIPITKKTVQPILRINKTIIDTISSAPSASSIHRINQTTKNNHTQHVNHVHVQNGDADSTFSTLTTKSKYDSDSTTNSNINQSQNNNNSNNNNNNNNKNRSPQQSQTQSFPDDNNINNTNINISDNTSSHINGSTDINMNMNVSNNNNKNNNIKVNMNKNNQHINLLPTKHINNNNNNNIYSRKRKLNDINTNIPQNPSAKRRKIDNNNNNNKNNNNAIFNNDIKKLVAEISKYDISFKYGEKWCNYCGIKISSKWNTKNKLLLCFDHSNQYENDKSFKKLIDSHKITPQNPINSNSTQCKEHEYLKNKLKTELLNKKQKLKL